MYQLAHGTWPTGGLAHLLLLPFTSVCVAPPQMLDRALPSANMMLRGPLRGAAAPQCVHIPTAAFAALRRPWLSAQLLRGAAASQAAAVPGRQLDGSRQASGPAFNHSAAGGRIRSSHSDPRREGQLDESSSSVGLLLLLATRPFQRRVSLRARSEPAY
jgi:hypothetical protein